MVTKKDRRHSGYVTPRATVSKKDLERCDLFIDDFYDDWTNYRDGFREWFNDFKLIKRIRGRVKCRVYPELVEKRLRMNKKQKMLLKRRKLMKTVRKSFRLRSPRF
jgi:hypothetical protein